MLGTILARSEPSGSESDRHLQGGVVTVKTPFASKGLSQPARRRVELAIAVAQERLLATPHRPRARPHRARRRSGALRRRPRDLHRLLRLPEDEARIITTRALAIPGRARRQPPELAGTDGRCGSDRRGRRAPRRSLLGNLRQRLRGRINEELRRWIELEAARTEVALLDAHVENALSFVEILEHEVPFTEAVELYLEGARPPRQHRRSRLLHHARPDSTRRTCLAAPSESRPVPRKPASSRESAEARGSGESARDQR